MTHPHARGALLLVLLLALTGCSTSYWRLLVRGDAGVDDQTYFPSRTIPAGPDVWKLAKQESDTIKDQLLAEFGFSDVPTLMERTRSQALLVIQNNTIAFEAYGKGVTRETTVTSFSIAKSFVSTLIGELIHEGKIRSVDQAITEFLPELALRDPRFANIRLRDLLSMSSGLRYEPFPSLRNDDVETYYHPDLRSLALNSTEIEGAPGLRFHYNNFHPLLLGLIIERASGVSPSEYLSRTIWAPMGAEAPATWSLDSEHSGFEKMESGINARAIDFARFGCLVRDGGQRDGVQVIPGDWLDESLQDSGRGAENYYADAFGTKIKGAMNGGSYGYMWYGLSRNGSGRDDVFAAGNKSQILYISPDTGLVIVRFGYEDGLDFWAWIDGFYHLASG